MEKSAPTKPSSIVVSRQKKEKSCFSSSVTLNVELVLVNLKQKAIGYYLILMHTLL